MKKLFSLVTVLLCIVMLSTTAFAASTDPLSIYANYMKNSANITSLNMSLTQKLSMVDGTETVDVLKQDIAVKMRMPSEDKLEMEMRLVDPDTSEISYAYFKNNYLYQQVGNEKYKIKMDMDQALASSSANIDLNLTADILKNAKIEMLDEGMKITYKTDLNDAKDAQGNSITSMLEDLDLPDLKMSFSKMTTTAIIGYDGVLKSGSNVLGMKISDGDVNLEFKIVQTFKVNSINDVEFIRFPADLASYQLLTM